MDGVVVPALATIDDGDAKRIEPVGDRLEREVASPLPLRELP